MEIGSPEWQMANNVRPNGRGGWISNDQRGDGSFLKNGLIPLALLFGGGFGAQALGPAASAASGATAGAAPVASGVPNLAGAAGLPGGAMYGAAAAAPTVASNATGNGGGSALTSWLTRLRQYAPLALGGISAYKGLTQGPTDAENQLNEILGIAKNRVSASEPLFNELNASAMGDADRMRSRQAQADPMFEMLSKMTRSQMPRYTREG